MPIPPIFMLFNWRTAEEGGVPSGLEYTIRTQRMHFTPEEQRMHFKPPDQRLHYTVEEEDD